jgi:hypothetical protein
MLVKKYGKGDAVGIKMEVLVQKLNCVSFIQYLKPLTKENPYFFFKINSC